MIIALVISGVLNLVLLIGVFNLLKQTEQFEDRIILKRDAIRILASNALDRMNDADLKGAFKSDDEVGGAFTDIKAIIEGLNEDID